MLRIVERILEFNQLNQSGQELKILTPNQMQELSEGNNSEKVKLCSYHNLSTDQKNLSIRGNL